MLLFPDTNFFIQCRSPAELPWAEMSPDEEIRLFACRTVQGEIDRLKGDGRSRRSEHARRVSSWFAAVIDKGAPLTLRDRSPVVTLDLPPRIGTGHVYPPGLDLDRNDDRIVGEVLAFGTGRAVLLTGDTGMKLTARDLGLPFRSTPDTWRLAPEPDAKDKLFAELQRRVAVLERVGPTIELGLDDALKQPITLDAVHYEPLSEEVINDLVDMLLLGFPVQTDFSRQADPGSLGLAGVAGVDFARLTGREWRPPSPKAISDYNTLYAAWLRDARIQLGRLHRLLPGARARVQVGWTVRNVGSVPADGPIVRADASAGLALVDPASPSREALRGLPSPPEPPAWTL